MLIAFSGIDSAGKSTQINHIVKYYYEYESKVFVKWSRGGYTPGINMLKSLARNLFRNKIPAKGNSPERSTAFKNPIISRIWLFISILDLIIYYGGWFRILSIRNIVIADRYIWDTYIDFKMNFPGIDFQKWMSWRVFQQSLCRGEILQQTPL